MKVTEVELRGIKFGRGVFGASGVQGFFGEGYWFHKVWKQLFKMDMSRITFVSKTATLKPTIGNMPLTRQYTPQEIFPRCIKTKMHRGIVLNAVGLSNPGLPALLKTGKWQSRTKPFLISIGSVAKKQEQRIQEFAEMVEIIGEAQNEFSTPFGLQINFSCPNTSATTNEITKESIKVLDKMTLGIPIMLKYSIVTPIKVVKDVSDHQNCDGLCVSNTIPFGWDGIDWKEVWGSNTSPLAQFGGGGLSGKPLAPAVYKYIYSLRLEGVRKHINGSGGVVSHSEVNQYQKFGASSISIGSVAILRPWRVPDIIHHAERTVWYPYGRKLPMINS